MKTKHIFLKIISRFINANDLMYIMKNVSSRERINNIFITSINKKYMTNYQLYISILGALDEDALKEEIELAKGSLLELYRRTVEGNGGMTNIKALEIINAMIYDFALCVNTDILDYSKEDQLEAMKIAKNILAKECNKMTLLNDKGE